ncbi:MAG: DUF1919 domain-containing protein [Coriobacteriales bacterium]|nr:DUF1919 domain-containing protein [Coriobacteriales bacterium]
MKRFITKIEDTIIKSIRRLLLRDKSFSIISNNCWGGFVYQYFGMQYRSPFVGLFLFSDDYLTLLEDFAKYMETEMIFIDPLETKYKDELIKLETYGTYPIGKLSDIEIHFLHYESNEEAAKKWNQRKARINYCNLVIKYCDRDLATAESIFRFSELQYEKKVVLTAKEYPYKCCMKLRNENGEFVKNEWENFLKTVNVISFMNKQKW